MQSLNQKQLLYLKKNVFTPNQKTYCKKFEQQNVEIFNFKVNNKVYTLQYKNSKTYTNYIFQNTKHNTGFMHKGNKTRIQDFYGNTNYTEINTHKKIDKKL